MVRKLGFKVDTAENGSEALEATQRADYDIILMDCYMPRMDGFDATSAIRRLETTERRTTIIALTASGGADQERCLAAGMDDWISKPFKVADLEGVLEKWMPANRA